MSDDEDFDLEDWRQRRADAEAGSAALREEGDAYITRRRKEGASFRTIGDEMGLSHTAVRERAGEFDADEWIRSRVHRGAAGETADEWIRGRVRGSAAYARRRALTDRLGGINRDEGDQQ